MYKFVAQWLWYSSRLCASTRSVSLNGRFTQWLCRPPYTVSVLDGHSPPLSRLRVLKWVKFESLLGVLASSTMKHSLDGRLPWHFVLGSFPLWPLLAVCCLCIARDAVFHSMVDFPLCSMVDFLLFGQSPMDIFPLSMWDDLDVWGSPFLFVRLLQAVCGWGRDLSWSSSFSKMKLETSFSNVSQFTLLASIQSSKVLKWTLPVLCVMSGVLKGVNLLLTLLPDLPRVLKWIKSLSWTVYRGLGKESTFVYCCSLLPCVPSVGGLEMTLVDVLFTADLDPVDLKGLEFCG